MYASVETNLETLGVGERVIIRVSGGGKNQFWLG
jgi:hypothetical protein